MDYTAADLEQNRKIDELAHGLAELTARVDGISETVQALVSRLTSPPSDQLRQIILELEQKLRGLL